MADDPHDDGMTMGCGGDDAPVAAASGGSGGHACGRTAAAVPSSRSCCASCKRAGREGVKSVYMFSDFPRCRECYLAHLRRRTRAQLAKCGSRYGSRLVLGFSGGPSSRVLLEQITATEFRAGQSVDAVVLHIDTSVLRRLHAPFYTPEEAVEATGRTMAIARRSGLAVVHARLEDVFLAAHRFVTFPPADGDDSDPALLPELPDCSTKLNALFDAASTADARSELLEALMYHSLTRVTQALGRMHLLLGTSGTRIAERVIEYTTKGRGYALPVHVALMEWRDGRVLVCKPFHDMAVQLLALFCRFAELETVAFPSFTTMRPERDSIAGLAQGFLAHLTSGFADTVHNVLRTARKLKAPVPVASSDAVPKQKRAHRAVGGDDSVAASAAAAAPPLSDVAALLATAADAMTCPLCGDIVAKVGVEPVDLDPAAAVATAAAAEGPLAAAAAASAATSPLAAFAAVVCRGCQHLLGDIRVPPPSAAPGAGAGAPAAAPSSALLPPFFAEQAETLHKLSREEMRATFADCVLPDE